MTQVNISKLVQIHPGQVNLEDPTEIPVDKYACEYNSDTNCAFYLNKDFYTRITLSQNSSEILVSICKTKHLTSYRLNIEINRKLINYLQTISCEKSNLQSVTKVKNNTSDLHFIRFLAILREQCPLIFDQMILLKLDPEASLLIE